MMRRWMRAALLALSLGWLVALPAAGAAGQAVLWQVRLERYPQAVAYVSVYAADGTFVPDLTAEAFTVREAGQTRPVTAATATQPGLHIALALNPGRPFAIRDARGVPRHLYIFYQLQSWLEHEQAERHDLSLLTLNGPTVTHTDDPRAVLDALTDYYALQSRDFRAMTPELTPLVHAIAQAAAPSPRAGMGRVVLFVTAPIEGLQAADLELPRQQAQNAHIRVWVWLVAPPSAAESPQARWWADLAAATGGQFTLFSGAEVLPDLQQAFDRLDGVYQVAYRTAQSQPGTYPVQVTVRAPTGTLTTEEGRLDLNLQPPQVRWLAVPQEPVRGTAAIRLEVAVTFPDGQPRPLRRSALWVDGVQVAEHTAAPFERFEWRPEPDLPPGPHWVQIEVEDALGLVGAAPEVEVTLGPAADTPTGTEATATRPAPVQGETPTIPAAAAPPATPALAVWLAAGFAGAILVAALLWAWRGRPRTRGTGRPTRSPSPTPTAWGHLEPLPPLEPDWPTPPAVALTHAEVILGSDPAQAQVVLPDRSVSPRHARVWRTPEGRVFVADLHSLAGTWVNYAPVGAQGAALEPGDVLHVGRLGYRFVAPPEATP